jgi:hypothetical protein
LYLGCWEQTCECGWRWVIHPMHFGIEHLGNHMFQMTPILGVWQVWPSSFGSFPNEGHGSYFLDVWPSSFGMEAFQMRLIWVAGATWRRSSHGSTNCGQ